jgi:hypothetical protein
VVASQVWVALQAPDTQLCPVLHEAHFPPPVPQADSLDPATHLPALSQQPTQFVGPHGIGAQEPLPHCSAVLHSTQLAPPVPHAAALDPGMQTLL